MRRSAAAIVAIATLLGVVFCFPGPVAAGTVGGFASLAYDGTLTGSSDNYTTAHNAPINVSVEYTTTTLRVGQDAGFNIYRAILFFDTTTLPQGVSISAAHIALRLKANHATTTFDLVAVSPGDMGSPLTADDFEAITPHVQPLGSEVLGPDITIQLNAAGLGAIIHEGVTVICLRSSRDIAGVEPTGEEYVDLYSSEASYAPQLVITWDKPTVLGPPTTLSLSSGAVFSGYREPGDQLWLARAQVEYSHGADDLDPREYWLFQVVDIDSGEVMASTPLWSWGYVPVSVYLSASHALPWGDYSIRLVGSDVRYADPVPATGYVITSSDYRGSDRKALEQWIMATALDMGRVARGDVNYYRAPVTYIEPDKAAYPWRINDAGQVLFAGGIPLIDAVCPNLFVNPVIEGNRSEYGSAYGDLLWGNWGANLAGDWALIASVAGLPGQVAASAAFMLLVFAVVYVVVTRTGRPVLGLIPAAAGLLLGVMLGAPNIVILVSVLALATVYIVYEVVPTRT